MTFSATDYIAKLIARAEKLDSLGRHEGAKRLREDAAKHRDTIRSIVREEIENIRIAQIKRETIDALHDVINRQQRKTSGCNAFFSGLILAITESQMGVK